MTDLQLMFLLLAAVYFLIKFILIIILYQVTLRVEASAKNNKRKLKCLLEAKRKADREKHGYAYQQLQADSDCSSY